MRFSKYLQKLTINGHSFKQVVISDHYQLEHSDLSEELILDLVMTMNGLFRLPVDKDSNGFSYFVEDPLIFQGKAYRLIWCLPEDLSCFGVVNVFRVKEKKK